MLAISRCEDLIYACDTDTNRQSVFNAITGEKIRGDLEIESDEVLFQAWAQTQSIKLSYSVLRNKWDQLKSK